MGRSARPKPQRLAEKLLQIRNGLGLSQNGMLQQLDIPVQMDRARVSEYELGTHEPPLPILLKYARAANVWVDVLIDDELDLPPELPNSRKHEGVKHCPSGKRQRSGTEKRK